VIEIRSKTSYWRARAEKAEAELARLTTLRHASEHTCGEVVLWWKKYIDGWFGAVQVSSSCPSSVCLWWTPIPEVKEAE
jgi:hypothetical protein